MLNNKKNKKIIYKDKSLLLPTSLKYIIVIITTILALYPLYFVFINSFKNRIGYATDKIGFPTKVVFENFLKIFENSKIILWFSNTIFITVVSVTISLLIGSLAAFALSKMKFKGQSFILNSIISLMIVPIIVMIIPLFVLFGRLHLVNNFISVIVIYTGIMLPFNIYFLYSFFVTIPQALLDAAKIDGASNFQVYLRIMLPLARPALFALLLVNVLSVWNEFLISLIFLTKENLRTLMVGLTLLQGRFSLDVPLIMAGLIVGILPVLVLYLFSQRYLVRGLVAGAIKE